MQTTRSKAVIVAAVLVASTSLTLAQGGSSSGGSAGGSTGGAAGSAASSPGSAPAPTPGQSTSVPSNSPQSRPDQTQQTGPVQSPGTPLDTTGMAGSRPGCAPSTSAGVDTSTGGIRAPRIINDPAVGSGQTAETSAGGNSGLPKSSAAPSKANGC